MLEEKNHFLDSRIFWQVWMAISNPIALHCIALLKTKLLFGHRYLCNYCGNDWQIESHWSHELVIWMKMNLNMNIEHVEMNEDEIEVEHEHEIFLEPMWKWPTNWIRIITWMWSQAWDCIENIKFAQVNMKYSEHELQWTWTSVKMKYSCNKCGNEWRLNQTGACTLTLL